MKLLHQLKSGNKIFKVKFFRKNIPLIIAWSVTNRCNFKCSYCNVWKHKNEELKTKDVLRIINETSRLGTERIGFSGGEPLLRDDIGIIIKQCKNKGIYTTITTNGYLLAERFKDIREAGGLVISLDGKKDVHDMQRKKGSFERVLTFFEHNRNPCMDLSTSTVITDNTSKEDIDFVLQLAARYKFYCYFQPFREHNFSSNTCTLDKASRNYKELILYLIRKKKEGFRIAHSENTLKNYFRSPFNTKCWTGRLFMEIDADGSVYPCFDLIGRFKPLNCKEHSLKKCWDNLSNVKCEGCDCNAITEINNLMSFKPSVIINALKL